jgi:hypothetical protein
MMCEFLSALVTIPHIVVMDNLPCHKVAGIQEAIESRQARLLYLPPYSPDLNPIEQAFANVGATGANARKSHALTGIGGHSYRYDSFRILCRADLHLEELHARPLDNFLRSTRRTIIACTSPNLPATNEMYPTTEALDLVPRS